MVFFSDKKSGALLNAIFGKQLYRRRNGVDRSPAGEQNTEGIAGQVLRRIDSDREGNSWCSRRLGVVDYEHDRDTSNESTVARIGRSHAENSSRDESEF